MSLKYNKIRRKVVPIQEERYYKISKLFTDRLDYLSERSNTLLEHGRSNVANKYFKAGNIYFYLLTYLINIKAFADRNNLPGTICDKVNEKYKIKCVEDNLKCLSSEYSEDYVNFFERAKEIVGIESICVDEQEDCCVGIGEMIIESDTCKVFTVGPCDPPTEEEGFEFADCEFVLEEFNGEVKFQ